VKAAKYFLLDSLASFFQWLETWAGDMYNRTNYCTSCGKPKWSSQPCVKFEEGK
jgi:hypothetical protein